MIISNTFTRETKPDGERFVRDLETDRAASSYSMSFEDLEDALEALLEMHAFLDKP